MCTRFYSRRYQGNPFQATCLAHESKRPFRSLHSSLRSSIALLDILETNIPSVIKSFRWQQFSESSWKHRNSKARGPQVRVASHPSTVTDAHHNLNSVELHAILFFMWKIDCWEESRESKESKGGG